MTAMYAEDWRPWYHFTPPAYGIGDPNGLVYFEGEWHLCYQHGWPPERPGGCITSPGPTR